MRLLHFHSKNQNRPLTGAKRDVCPRSSVSTGGKVPGFPAESAPVICTSGWRGWSLKVPLPDRCRRDVELSSSRPVKQTRGDAVSSFRNIAQHYQNCSAFTALIKLGLSIMRWFLLRFDFDSTGDSTACQRSLRLQWRYPLAAVTLTYLIYLDRRMGV